MAIRFEKRSSTSCSSYDRLLSLAYVLRVLHASGKLVKLKLRSLTACCSELEETRIASYLASLPTCGGCACSRSTENSARCKVVKLAAARPRASTVLCWSCELRCNAFNGADPLVSVRGRRKACCGFPAVQGRASSAVTPATAFCRLEVRVSRLADGGGARQDLRLLAELKHCVRSVDWSHTDTRIAVATAV